jgi:hypothetical protein
MFSFVNLTFLVVENHDEPRAVHSFKTVERANAASLITFLLPGMRFHHHGQWKGKKNRLIVQVRNLSFFNKISS